jgi:hypothetical protein
MECPACSNKRGNKRYDENKIGLMDIHRCKKCGAVFGSCYLGDSYSVVLPQWHTDPNPPSEDLFYFDIEALGSQGIQRRHGWAHKTTRRIVQVG